MNNIGTKVLRVFQRIFNGIGIGAVGATATVLGVLSAIVLVTITSFVMMFIIIGFTIVFAACWIVGRPITIKYKDEVIGTLRWFTYTSR